MNRFLLLLTILLGTSFLASATEFIQPPDSSSRDTLTYDVVIKNDGVEYIGTIVSQDEREVIIDTKTIGRVVIPKHEIKEIKKVSVKDLDEGGRRFDPVFSTRYFLTTNGLPIEKGESYVQWNLFGPDIQFGAGKRFGFGIMTSWIGIPLVGSVKYSFPITDNLNLGAGALFGTAGWANLSAGGVLPFGAITVGNRKSNLNLSIGHLSLTADGESTNAGLMSIGAMTAVSPKISLVFDSVLVPSENVLVAAMCMRWQSKPGKAIQFGLPTYIDTEGAIPLPIPMIQWYRTLN